MTRNLITAKTIDEVKLSGVKLDWEKQDGSVRSITITDANGNSVRITKANSYSEAIAILVPEPPKMEDRWVLQGEFANVRIRRAFETEREANTAKDEFPSHAALEVVKAEVEVIDGKPTQPDDEIPF